MHIWYAVAGSSYKAIYCEHGAVHVYVRSRTASNLIHPHSVGKRKEDSTIHVLDMDVFQKTNELSDAESAQRIHKTEDLESGIQRSW